MTASHDARSPIIEWAAAGRALGAPGEAQESGDLHVVALFEEGALVAAIDGLGHGTEAAIAAQTAGRLLEQHAGEPVGALIERCHEGLRGTRGAVMTLASFDGAASLMHWIAVGNVEGVLFRADRRAPSLREYISARGGVVGYRIPTLREAVLPIARGDTLVLATDGIRSGFADDVRLERSPGEIADWILAQHARTSDDALVVVARFLGSEP